MTLQDTMRYFFTLNNLTNDTEDSCSRNLLEGARKGNFCHRWGVGENN